MTDELPVCPECKRPARLGRAPVVGAPWVCYCCGAPAVIELQGVLLMLRPLDEATMAGLPKPDVERIVQTQRTVRAFRLTRGERNA